MEHYVYKRHPVRDGRWGITVEEYLDLVRYRLFEFQLHGHPMAYQLFFGLPGSGREADWSPLGDVPLAQ